MEEDIANNIDPERTAVLNTKTIVVVRHAESVANTQGIYQGQTYDTDLSELGKKQAKALAKRLKIFGAQKVICSPLKRALQTAKMIATEINCQLEISEAIIETNHGIWEGRHKDWVSQNFPDTYSLWLKKPSEVVFPGGEAFMNTIQRTLNFLENTDFLPNTVVITHDNILRVMISLIANTDIDRMWEIPLETASLNFFEVNKIDGRNVFRILKLNDVAHLRDLRNNINTHAL